MSRAPHPVTVVALFAAKPGNGPRVIDAFRVISPLVHKEAGCELYAAHLEQDGDHIIMVERWSSRTELDAHAAGAPLARLKELTADLLLCPYKVWFLDGITLGDERQGAIPTIRIDSRNPNEEVRLP